MNADFAIIVATLCGVKLEEVVVAKGSKEEKDLFSKAAHATLPILQVDDQTFISDSFAIAQYLARSTSNEKLLGSNDFE
jgi:glutathione S-transferase